MKHMSDRFLSSNYLSFRAKPLVQKWQCFTFNKIAWALRTKKAKKHGTWSGEDVQSVEWRGRLCGPVSWQMSPTVISRRGTITRFQGPLLFRDAHPRILLWFYSHLQYRCWRGFLLLHTKESLSSTENIMGASHLGLPLEVLTSFRNKSRGRQRRGKKHWIGQCEKAEW